MSGPTKKKQQRVEKNDEETAFIAASNSLYNTMMPMHEARFVRFHHPHKAIDIHCATDSQTFTDTFGEFCAKGLKDKLVSEMRYFADHYDPRWNEVLDRALASLPSEETADA